MDQLITVIRAGVLEFGAVDNYELGRLLRLLVLNFVSDIY